MTNIQQNHHNNASDISTALIPGLIVSDRDTSNVTEKMARDMRIIAAPRHPGRDPVSVHIVEQLVSVLRGEGGLAPRMTDITDRLRDSATKLELSLRGYQSADQATVDTFRRLDDQPRP
jgi:hypothetical protein